MKTLTTIKDTYKILIIYLISTIVTMLAADYLVEYDYIKSCLKNYLLVLIVFTLIFLILIKIFKIRFKSVLIFLGIIMFLLIFLLLNIDFFISIASTPNKDIFPIITFISIYTTLPFQSLINALVGYDIAYLSYIIVPIYMIMLTLLSYVTLNFKIKELNNLDILK